MNTSRTTFRNDLHRDPNELENEADRAREHLEHTLEALERRLSPGELLDHALRTVRGNGSEFGHNLALQVRNNPVPVVLTGVGLAWLVSASNRPPPAVTTDSEGGVLERAAGAASSVRNAADSARSTVQRAADTARTAASDTANSVRSAAQHAAEATQRVATETTTAARHVSGAARSGADSVFQGYDYLRREQPLVLGALAVAAGALIGALIPSSRAEGEVMGEYRDRAIEKTRDAVKRKSAQVGEVAADVAETALESARESAGVGVEDRKQRKGPASAAPTAAAGDATSDGQQGTGSGSVAPGSDAAEVSPRLP